MSKILRDDLRYLVFSEIFLRFDEPKRNRRAFSLIESAIQSFDRRGYVEVTFTMVARDAGISVQGLRAYFRNLEEVRDTSLKYIRLLGQKMALERIGKSKNPAHMLTDYVCVHFDWAKIYSVHARVWLSFLVSGTRRKSDRRVNQLAVTAGFERLIQMIQEGKRANIFRCEDEKAAAKLVQTLLTGWTLTLLTEDVDHEAQNTRAVVNQCLTIVGFSPA